MLTCFKLPLCLYAGEDPPAGIPASKPKISLEDLLRAPTMPRVEMFLLQFSADHEVTIDEVEVMAAAFKGLDAVLGRALRGRAKIIIDRFGTDEAKELARDAGLLDK